MPKIVIDDVIREMTEEEVKEYEAESQRIKAELANRKPTPEERIAQLEEALNMLLEGVTEDG